MKLANEKIFEDSWWSFFESTLDSLRQGGTYRTLTLLSSSINTRVEINGSRYLLFCSNDYLGLANNGRMKQAAMKAVEKWGTGSGASRLISGNISLYGLLEDKIAKFKGTESAIVFSSGYATNVGVISSIGRQGDLILSDELNHASIVDACRLAKADVLVYPHKDMDRLRAILAKRKVSDKVLIVTDGIFSMDGDLAPLPELLELVYMYDALLLVDDAHATGVIGPNGAGTLDYFGIESKKILQVGTFSKALGSLGGFVACEKLVAEFIINYARSLIYSTALPPAVLAANSEAIDIVAQEGAQLRKKLAGLTDYLKKGIQKIGLAVPDQPTPIIPVIIGDARETVALSKFLWEQKIFVPPIRPPTVPKGKSRLRVSLSALHEYSDLDVLVQTFEAFFRKGA